MYLLPCIKSIFGQQILRTIYYPLYVEQRLCTIVRINQLYFHVNFHACFIGLKGEKQVILIILPVQLTKLVMYILILLQLASSEFMYCEKWKWETYQPLSVVSNSLIDISREICCGNTFNCIQI